MSESIETKIAELETSARGCLDIIGELRRLQMMVDSLSEHRAEDSRLIAALVLSHGSSRFVFADEIWDLCNPKAGDVGEDMFVPQTMGVLDGHVFVSVNLPWEESQEGL